VFHRTIAEASTGKAISLVMVSAVVVMLGTIAILAAELGEIPQYLSRGKFLDLLFEVVSAFGTVGLSTGVTGELSLTGKLIITLVMFVGRLGPLAVIVAISHRESASYYYAEENILIG
jgi:trk system potassium uptake protein TrkH